MSYDNAISVRGQMNLTYQKMLEEETDPKRAEDIKKQIRLNEEEINQLRQGKPLFGAAPILKQETIIIESDPETKGQKVTILDEKGNTLTPETAPIDTTEDSPVSTESEEPPKPPTKKVGNKLRDLLQSNAASSAEESLKAKVLAAKASKSKTV